MGFQDDPNVIRWRLHVRSPPDEVHRVLATSEGRARFWAESAAEFDGEIEFRFPDGTTLRGRVVENRPPHRFAVRYFGGSLATFDLADDGAGGTDLTLTETDVPLRWRDENTAGWVSVLMALKAAIDFSVDLRNHDPSRTWARGYVEN